MGGWDELLFVRGRVGGWVGGWVYLFKERQVIQYINSMKVIAVGKMIISNVNAAQNRCL